MTQLAGRRKDPKYSRVTGEVDVDRLSKFKAMCALKKMSLSEALDVAIENWMELEKDILNKI